MDRLTQRYILLPLAALTLLGATCTKKDPSYQPTDALGITNKWVYDSLKRYYYWSQELPAKPDYSLPTYSFFQQLLSAKDRFSWISNRSDITAPETTAEKYGFHYAWIDHPFNPGQLAGVITLVVPDSHAGRIGLQRGTFFTKVNDKAITAENCTELSAALTSNSQAMLQLAVLNTAGTALVDSERVAVQDGYVGPKAIYNTRVFEQNGIKTGYLTYFYCTDKEDGVVLAAIQRCQQAGVSEMILDLRYNPGGSVAAASKLAATLVTAFDPDNTFVIYKGNSYGGEVKQSFREAIAFSGNATGKDMSYLQSLNLHLRRLFVLVSPSTASAAELIANGLRPYIPVTLIGDTTHGKDEASFLIEDKGTPQQSAWIMMPTIYKLFNAAGKGDYSGGLIPAHFVNDFSILPLPEAGMPGDPSVNKALQLIYGNASVNSTNLRKKTYRFPAVRQYMKWVDAGNQPVEMKRR